MAPPFTWNQYLYLSFSRAHNLFRILILVDVSMISWCAWWTMVKVRIMLISPSTSFLLTRYDQQLPSTILTDLDFVSHLSFALPKSPSNIHGRPPSTFGQLAASYVSYLRHCTDTKIHPSYSSFLLNASSLNRTLKIIPTSSICSI